MAIRVGYQGNHGTFSEIAVMEYFRGRDYEPVGCRGFAEIMSSCDDGSLDYALLPVENTTTGIIARTYDLFRSHAVQAVGEIVVPIREDLIVVPGTNLDAVRKVYSHPEALSQCQKFFAQHPSIQPIAYQDTAASVELVKKGGDPSVAALASSRAAEYYGMESLLRNVQDSDTNMTRFLCVTAHEEQHPEADKISMMLVLKHEPGALYEALGALAAEQINVMKLESRPIIGHPFQYLFYIDFTGNIADPRVTAAMKALSARCSEARVLGCYKAAVRVM